MKAILVIDVPYITEPCEIDELGLVADMHIRPTTLSLGKSFDLKDVDVRPLPQPKNNSDEWIGDVWVEGYEAGWNKCLKEITE